jgi:hypothetical protein
MIKCTSLLLAATAACLLLNANAYAKPGKIVKGENGTKWCCVDGVKGDTCEKGASSIPVGAHCNFASRTAPGGPKSGGTVKGTVVVSPNP